MEGGDLLFRHKAAKFWRPGSHKSETKWLNQFANRGWTPEDLTTPLKQENLIQQLI